MSGVAAQLFTAKTHLAVASGFVPLWYERPPCPELDIAAHVRSASAVRLWGDRLLIVQDDVNAVATSQTGSVSMIALPASSSGERSFDADRGNKQDKLDLEASVVLPDGRVVVFGSGSTAARERLVTISERGLVQVHDGEVMYRAMRAEPAFAGSELNVEGAVIVGEWLRFFQRGNGADIDGRKPVNATADVSLSAFLDWLDKGATPPTLEHIVSYDLGSIHGVPWTFTDAAILPDGTVVFIGAAEASPDTYFDGAIVGSCVGISDGSHLEVLPVVNEAGRLMRVKLEGIEHQPGAGLSFLVVADMDDAALPAQLGLLRIVKRSDEEGSCSKEEQPTRE